MKRLKISRLMDEYEDNEFFPEGGSTADVEAIKDRVLAQVGTAKKRQTPPLKAVLLAAALAAASVLCIAAAVGGPVVRYISGAMYENGVFDGTAAVSPVAVEDGRIWFVANGQHLDITDLIDAETPYLYTYTDPQTNTTTYTAVGGTIEDLGWFEYALFYDNGDKAEAGTVGENYYTHYVWNGEAYVTWDELTPEQEKRLSEMGSFASQCEYRPWAVAAEEALVGIDCFH